MSTFLEESGEIVASLRAALPGEDTETLRRGAHSLKSGAQDMGAGHLATASARLEARARDGWPDGAADDVETIGDAFDAAGAELRAWLAGQASGPS